jgi:hypothetical protein
LVGAEEGKEMVTNDKGVCAQNSRGINVVALLGIHFGVAADAFQALG